MKNPCGNPNISQFARLNCTNGDDICDEHHECELGEPDCMSGDCGFKNLRRAK